MSFDALPIERALGIEWCVESDSFQFRIILKDQPLTRRGILSTVSSVYDPLGFLAPFILTGKLILQEMCREGMDWDEPLPELLRPKWEQWRSDLPSLTELKIRRCFKPEGFSDLKTVEIHHFSDASFTGYGQCSYSRLVDINDKVHCSLIMGKARVAPLKIMTIPRLTTSCSCSS